MEPKSAIQEQIIIQSLVESEQLIHSTRSHLEKLIFMSELVKNVLFVGKKYEGTKSLPDLFVNNIIIEENGKLFMNPLTTDEQESYITSDLFIEITKSDKLILNSLDVSISLDLLKELMDKKKYFQEIIPIFISYLFPKAWNSDSFPNKKINDDLLLDLYIMLAEQYKLMLEKRDIENMALLGQKTIQLIIDTMYKRINNHSSLCSIDKGVLMLYMKRFFYTITKTITFLSPS